LWSWGIILIVILILLLLIEEGSQFIWRRYLKEPEEAKNSRLAFLITKVKKTIQKDSKNPSA
jgi:C4-dicarboxylate-specific signal transduction histidine kinase